MPSNEACAAARFLEARRGSDGLWRSFRTLAGASSEWVSGFVAHALARLHPGLARDALQALLPRQRADGGWGYNGRTPSDADSTAWVVLALSAAGLVPADAGGRARAYLLAHQASGGGFATYAAGDGIAGFIDAPEDVTRGWRAAHVCVTGTVTRALLALGEQPGGSPIQGAWDFLRRARREALWSPYWWTTPAYATAQALAALAVRDGQGLAQAAAEALMRTQSGDGGWPAASGGASCAFATSFSLLALLRSPDVRHARPAAAAADCLRRQQEADGSWRAGPILRIPPPMEEDAEVAPEWRIDALGTGVVLSDQSRLFTTAAALWALADHHAREAGTPVVL